MVKPSLRPLALAAMALLSLSPLAAKEPADYRVGDLAEEDITTPIALEVIDVEATQALKERESTRGPVTFCFYPNWAVEAEAAFHSAFVRTRSNFLGAVELVFRHRPLSPQELAATNFQEFLPAFQKQNNLFPVETNLAVLWASGESGQAFESRLLAQLRQTMRSPVRSDYVPPGISVGRTVRMLTVTNGVTPTVEMAAALGVNLHKTNLTSIPRSKMELQDRLPPEQAAAAQYLATFIKPNCFIDVELTRGLRLKNTEALWTGDRYAAGQTIVKRGEAVDKKIKAALDELKEKTAVSRLQQAIANDQLKAEQARQRNRWLIAGVSSAFALSIIVVWRLARRRPASLLPARAGGGCLAGEGADADWQRRALTAEQRAEKANAVIRQGLIAHLARWMSDTVLQKLIQQRTHLLDTQQKAASEMDVLGERLDTLHSRMQDRLTAYELQIAELERKLDAKDEVNRELIRSEINMIKRQLETERAKQMDFN